MRSRVAASDQYPVMIDESAIKEAKLFPTYFRSISGKLFVQSYVNVLAVYTPQCWKGFPPPVKTIASIHDLYDHFKEVRDNAPATTIL